jgi:hypothetical protein
MTISDMAYLLFIMVTRQRSRRTEKHKSKKNAKAIINKIEKNRLWRRMLQNSSCKPIENFLYLRTAFKELLFKPELRKAATALL